ncbi:MAG: LAGLIDADG family homing endonuclease [Frankiaceae bacterium]|nr:LAGLIDADG family homing endonuclease [Frankiaceae bacterium]
MPVPQHGPGKKHDPPIVLAPWQQEVVDEHPGLLLRGLFNSDGWRGHNVAVKRHPDGFVTRYRYSRYKFTNKSDDIRALCTDGLDRLGIAWRPNGALRVSVNRRAAVAALAEHVGPKS